MKAGSSGFHLQYQRTFEKHLEEKYSRMLQLCKSMLCFLRSFNILSFLTLGNFLPGDRLQVFDTANESPDHLLSFAASTNFPRSPGQKLFSHVIT
jgi:hypothetical protein